MATNSDKKSVKASAAKTAVAKKANATPEKLTNDVVCRLVGHTNVLYYNCETNAWNTDKYNGYEISGRDIDANDVKEFKTMMENEPVFGRHYEFVASVAMTISRDTYFKGALDKKTIDGSEYKNGGTAIAGNIIVRNKATGKYELYCKSWSAVNCYQDQGKAVSNLGSELAIIATGDSEFFEDLIAAHKMPADTKLVKKKPVPVANLSRVAVVKDDKAPQIKPVTAPVDLEKVTLTSEKLTDAVVEGLIGHTNVIYYNYETKALNTTDYGGSKIESVFTIQWRMDNIARNIKKIPEFSAHYELVALVIMTTDRDQYYNRFYPIANPVYCRKGIVVAGNMIVKNKVTGKYELYCNYWFTVGLYDHPADKDRAAYLGMLDIDVGDSYNRAAVLAMHTRPFGNNLDNFYRELAFYDALFPAPIR